MSAPEIVMDNRGDDRRRAAIAQQVLADARRLLRDALPAEAVGASAPLAAVMHLNADEEEVLAALHVFALLPLPAAARRPQREPVTVDVASHRLSVAGVVALLDDGAVRPTDRPLQAGTYWCATVKTGGECVARFWFPECAAHSEAC